MRTPDEVFKEVMPLYVQNGPHFMCIVLDTATFKGLITEEEAEKARKEISDFLQYLVKKAKDEGIYVSDVDEYDAKKVLSTALGLFDVSWDVKVGERIYSNWKARESTVLDLVYDAKTSKVDVAQVFKKVIDNGHYPAFEDKGNTPYMCNSLTEAESAGVITYLECFAAGNVIDSYLDCLRELVPEKDANKNVSDWWDSGVSLVAARRLLKLPVDIASLTAVYADWDNRPFKAEHVTYLTGE